jgi:hypothetical protein
VTVTFSDNSVTGAFCVYSAEAQQTASSGGALLFRQFPPASLNRQQIEPVPKLIDCALTRTVLEQALAVFQAKALQNCIF